VDEGLFGGRMREEGRRFIWKRDEEREMKDEGREMRGLMEQKKRN